MSGLEIERIDGVPIAYVREDIDAANASRIQRQLADALEPEAFTLVIDLSETRYLDSAGIDMLLRLSDVFDSRRATLILVIPDASPLKRLVTIVSLPDAIAVHPTLRQALQVAAKPQTQHPAPSPNPGDSTAGCSSEHPDLSIEVSSAPDACTIVLAGEADLYGVPRLEAALKDACAGEPALIVIDLSHLTFIDSSGLHALVAGNELCRALGCELRIIPGPANVQRLFELTGMNDVLPLVDTQRASRLGSEHRGRDARP